MDRTAYGIAFLIALCVLPAAAYAQEGPGAAERGDRSILVGWGGGANLGAWMRLGDRTDLGLEGGLRTADDDDSSSWLVSLRPALKRYLGDSEAPVALYWVGGLLLTWTETELASLSVATTHRELGAFMGLGLDWFPAERVSVGGHIAIEGAATRRRTPALGVPDSEVSGYEVGTLSSGIRLQLYF